MGCEKQKNPTRLNLNVQVDKKKITHFHGSSENTPTPSTMSQTSNLSSLSRELKQSIASYLSIHSVCALSKTCKSIHSDLALSTASPSFQLQGSEHWYAYSYADGDIPRCYRPIPILFPGRTHSVCVQCIWRDQGWGNLKGRLYIVEHSASNHNSNGGRFGNGVMVAISPIASHFETACKLWFSPKSDHTYKLWYSVGGGGGHELLVDHLTVTTLIHDDDKSFSQAHAFVGTSGLLVDPLPNKDFVAASIISMAQSLLDQLEQKPTNGVPVALDRHLSQFFESRGMNITPQSLKALMELVKTIQSLQLEKALNILGEESDDDDEDSDFSEEELDDNDGMGEHDIISISSDSSSFDDDDDEMGEQGSISISDSSLDDDYGDY